MADQKTKSALETEFETVRNKVHAQVQGSMFGKGLLPLVKEIFNFMGKLVLKIDELDAKIRANGNS